LSFTDFGPLVTTIASELISIVPNLRSIAGFIADVTIEEQHVDRLRITEHPVEQGAASTDHSYKMPAQVTIRAGWSNSSIQALGNPFYIQGIYASFLALQSARQPFGIITGKRAYTNMLIESLVETTDKEHENAMVLTVECKEIIIVTTQTVTVGQASNMANPSSNAPTYQVGTLSPTSNPTLFNAMSSPPNSFFPPS
jgi:hypothetical protein